MTIAPETGDAIVRHNLYWWHQAALRELRDYGPNIPAGIGSVTKSTTMDAERACRQLHDAGMVEVCEPPPYGDEEWRNAQTWYEITPRGRDWADC